MGFFDRFKKEPSLADTVKDLSRLCGGGGNSYQVRNAVSQLKELGAPALDALRNMLRERESQFDAVCTLGCLGTYASGLTPSLMDATVGDDPANSIALAKLGDVADKGYIPGAVDLCTRVAQSTRDESTRRNALWGLECVARSSDPIVVRQAVACLTEMASHPGERTRQAAIDALGFIMTESARQHGVHAIHFYEVQNPIDKAARDSSGLVQEAARDAYQRKERLI
jgi:HEAT repeat protein